MRVLSRMLPLLAIFAVTACRTVSVASEPRPTYSIEVRNETGTAMIVSYNDGRGDAVLGTVTPNHTERFIIAAPATTTVTVRAIDETRTRSAGPYTVQLVAGVAQPVLIR